MYTIVCVAYDAYVCDALAIDAFTMSYQCTKVKSCPVLHPHTLFRTETMPSLHHGTTPEHSEVSSCAPMRERSLMVNAARVRGVGVVAVVSSAVVPPLNLNTSKMVDTTHGKTAMH